MATKQEILEEIKFLSDRISVQVRTISLGLLAITWGLLIAESNVAIEIARQMGKSLMIIGGLAILTMFFDFLQYFFGYWFTNSLLKEMEKANRSEAKYRYSDWRYRFRGYLFWIKQISLFVGVVWFLAALLKYIF